jgi:DNA-binding transcriptional regulator YiaG
MIGNIVAKRGEKLAEKPYLYKQCGLDNVYLLNGFSVHETPDGKAIAVQDVEGLHRAIAMHLCLNKANLIGKEFKFLRKLLDKTQADIATLFKCDSQTVARWEKEKSAINGPAEQMIRLLYLNEVHNIRKLVTELAELDEKEQKGMNFRKDGDWLEAA